MVALQAFPTLSLTDGCFSFSPVPPSFQHWMHQQAVCLMGLVSFLFLQHLHTISLIPATHRADSWTPTWPTFSCETEVTWRSAIFVHKILFSSFSTCSATIRQRSRSTAGSQQHYSFVIPSFADQQRGNWMASASWSGMSAPHSLLQMWSS